jgi:hypothetical protein
VIALVEIGLLAAFLLVVLANAMIELPPVKVRVCYSLCREGITLLQHEFGSVVSC